MKYDDELHKSIESENWESSSDKNELIDLLKQAAKNTVTKDYRLNIRITKRDIDSIKEKALKLGMPYQTYISSILHRVAKGEIV
ncbi:antitoxin [bacterium]|nr:MAG: antitoxin [bacterium]